MLGFMSHQCLQLYKSFMRCKSCRYLCFVQFFYFFLHEYTFPSNLLSWPGHSQHPGNPLQEYHVNLNTKTHNILLNASNSSHQTRLLPAHLTLPVCPRIGLLSDKCCSKELPKKGTKILEVDQTQRFSRI